MLLFLQRDDVNLSSYSQHIQVHTNTEVTRHVDISASLPSEYRLGLIMLIGAHQFKPSRDGSKSGSAHSKMEI